MPRLVFCARLAFVLAICLLVPACKSKVTKANYDKITDGLALEDVEKILGKGSKETGDGSNVAGQFGVAITAPPTVGGGDVYVWETNTATVRITFKQGKVVHRQAKWE